MKKKVTVVYDGQFGSTGKGLMAGYLAEFSLQPDVCITSWGPNAGHTYYDSRGNKMVHTMLAQGIVSPKIRHQLISAGSYVHLDNLCREIDTALHFGYGDYEVLIHENAAICGDDAAQMERAETNQIGSTQKGMGASMVRKIHRRTDSTTPAVFGQVRKYWQQPMATIQSATSGQKVVVRMVSQQEYNKMVDQAQQIMVEGAQGFSLGINSGMYPYTTSRECGVAQILSDAQIPPAMVQRTICCIRTFPIRVANRWQESSRRPNHLETSTMIGYSGPHYEDQREISWADLHEEPEVTTVTKLERRVFTFSPTQLHDCLRANSMGEDDEIFLNFVNYLKEDKSGYLDPALVPNAGWHTAQEFIDRVGNIASTYGAKVRYLGHGARPEDITDLQTSGMAMNTQEPSCRK